LSITFSAGVCPVPEQGAAEEPAGQRALRLADALMYRAKNAGRDRIIAGDDDTHPEQERE
jgi:GGDEF domain-containing protein